MKQPKYRLSVNDFILFSIAGAVGLASGYIYQVCKWLMLIYVLSGLMVAWLHHFTFIWFYAVPTTSANEKMLLGVFMNGSLLDVSVNGARPPIRIQNSQLKNVMTPLVHPIFLAVVAPPLQINSCVVFLGKAATIVD